MSARNSLRSFVPLLIFYPYAAVMMLGVSDVCYPETNLKVVKHAEKYNLKVYKLGLVVQLRSPRSLSRAAARWSVTN